MRIALLVVDGPAAGSVLELPADRVVVGRAIEGLGNLGGDTALSRRHAEFARSGDGSLTVRDLGSTNGTFVNSLRIVDASVLGAGDRIRVGETTLEVVGPAEDGGETAIVPAEGGVVIGGGQHAGHGGVVVGRDIHGDVQTRYVDQSRHYQRVDVDASGYSLFLRTSGFGRFLVILGTVVALAGFASFAYPIVRGITDAASGQGDLDQALDRCDRLDDPFERFECVQRAHEANAGFGLDATPWIPLGGILFLAGIVLTWAGIFTVRRDRDEEDRR